MTPAPMSHPERHPSLCLANQSPTDGQARVGHWSPTAARPPPSNPHRSHWSGPRRPSPVSTAYRASFGGWSWQGSRSSPMTEGTHVWMWKSWRRCVETSLWISPRNFRSSWEEGERHELEAPGGDDPLRAGPSPVPRGGLGTGYRRPKLRGFPPGRGACGRLGRGAGSHLLFAALRARRAHVRCGRRGHRHLRGGLEVR